MWSDPVITMIIKLYVYSMHQVVLLVKIVKTLKNLHYQVLYMVLFEYKTELGTVPDECLAHVKGSILQNQENGLLHIENVI